MAKYQGYYDPRRRTGPAIAIKGSKGTRRVQSDKMWKIDGRKMDPYEKSNSVSVTADSYYDARKKILKKLRKHNSKT